MLGGQQVLMLLLHAVALAVEQPLDLGAGAEKSGALLREVLFQAQSFVHDHHGLACVEVCEVVLQGEQLGGEAGNAVGEVGVEVQHVEFGDG